LVTVSLRLVNVAVTVLAAFIVTVQTLPAVVAQPVHEVNAEVEAAVAVSCTAAFGSNWPEQLSVQLRGRGRQPPGEPRHQPCRRHAVAP
jgi:hypothetical protein